MMDGLYGMLCLPLFRRRIFFSLRQCPRLGKSGCTPSRSCRLSPQGWCTRDPGQNSPSLGPHLTFATRTGHPQGIDMRIFRVENQRDLSAWTRALVQGCHASAELTREVTISCSLRGESVSLSIHYDTGFTLCRGGPSGPVMYRYPFEKLRMSADDGTKNLYLDFGGPEGELALDLHTCPKPVVFLLHTFLSAKVTRMGLLA
ncbi:unnamed protein product [Ranitomeya imitator]|uniref:Syntrophin C-terminal PH domain-containing protein n=1 Tax=Ranitomeya imitator TaxID=111125 RepID=A0ABN9L100_9NEOB|nr:unnamed protein product [Ranitomeya imitator]